MNRRARRAARHNPPAPPPPVSVEPADAETSATFHFPDLPAPGSDRLASLDLLRGFSVMGILLMNIVAFAMPSAATINPAAWGSQSGADLAAWALSFILVDGKMRGLFSLLFGASMLLVMEKAAMDGRDPIRAQAFRLAWLALFGAAHFLLLWWGDILLLYACIGAVAMAFVGREPLALAKLAFLCFGTHIIWLLVTMVPAWRLAAAAADPGASAAVKSAYESLLAGFAAPGGPDIAREVALYSAPWTAIFQSQLIRLPGHLAFSIFNFGLDTLGFMLLGMAMLKAGFLAGSWTADQYRRTARHCFLVFLPPMVALAALDWARDFSTMTVFGNFFLWSLPSRIALTVGYAALVLWLLTEARSAGTLWLLERIKAAGRMAFTNYLASSLIMTAIFYGWGLGLFGQVERVALYPFVIGAWALMLLWSKPWLDRFTYGPMEWLWRSLSRGGAEKMRRTQ